MHNTSSILLQAKKLAQGNKEISTFLGSLYDDQDYSPELDFLTFLKLNKDEILQIIEIGCWDPSSTRALLTHFTFDVKIAFQLLYGIKYAFPITLLNGEQLLAVVRESQLPHLLPFIQRRMISRKELLAHIEGVSFTLPAGAPFLTDVSYDRYGKTVVARQVSILTEEPVFETLGISVHTRR